MPANLPYVLAEPIVTARLRLRSMVASDVDALHAYMSRADVCEYLLFSPRDRDTVGEKIAEFAAHTRLAVDGDYLELAVERVADGQVMGHVYFALESAANECAEVGWTLHPDYQKQGFAFEAASAILKVAFENLNLHRVVAKLDPRNDASVALCGRLGMRAEAHHIKDYLVKGQWEDTGVHAILADEWHARART